MNYIYEEKIYLPVILILISLFAIGFVVFAWFTEDVGDEKMFWISTGIAMAAIIFSTINFACLNIRVTENILQFRFGLFKKEVYIKNIIDLKKEKFSIFRFGGYGIRFGRGKVLGYVARGGYGIQFEDKNKKRKYYVSSEKADELMSLLVNYGAQKA